MHGAFGGGTVSYVILALSKTLSKSGGERWFTVLKVSPLESLSSVPFVFTTGCKFDVFLWVVHTGFLFYFLNLASGLVSVLMRWNLFSHIHFV